jgi:hypothetical protein
MRVVGHIPHPSISITVFHMNEKYIVKMEAGPMEQSFKFPQDQFPGLEAIKKIVDEEFVSKAHVRFNEMFLDMKATMERSKTV